jgi:AcrR family transcriptional regulator
MPATASSIEPRKSPRQARAKATVEAILEASAHILETAGLEALTTNAVAERAGVSIGSLYQYFPAKQAILAALIRRKHLTVNENISRAAKRERERQSSLKEAVAALVEAGAAYQLAHPRLARSLEYAEAMLPLDAEIIELQQQLVAAVASVLVAHKAADPLIAARDTVALARGMLDAGGMYGEADLPSLLDRIKRAVLGYLQTT